MSCGTAPSSQHWHSTSCSWPNRTPFALLMTSVGIRSGPVPAGSLVFCLPCWVPSRCMGFSSMTGKRPTAFSVASEIMLSLEYKPGVMFHLPLHLLSFVFDSLTRFQWRWLALFWFRRTLHGCCLHRLTTEYFRRVKASSRWRSALLSSGFCFWLSAEFVVMTGWVNVCAIGVLLVFPPTQLIVLERIGWI